MLDFDKDIYISLDMYEKFKYLRNLENINKSHHRQSRCKERCCMRQNKVHSSRYPKKSYHLFEETFLSDSKNRTLFWFGGKLSQTVF